MDHSEIIMNIAEYLAVLRKPEVKDAIMETCKMGQTKFDKFTSLSTWDYLVDDKKLLACENRKDLWEAIANHIQVWNVGKRKHTLA